MSSSLPVARTATGTEVSLLSSSADRHGLITGATGTGKTVTLQVLAEQYSTYEKLTARAAEKRLGGRR